MITLNLISEEFKYKLKLKKSFLRMESFLCLIFIFFVLAGIIFIFTKNMLQKNFNELVSLNSLVVEDSPKIIKEINDLNLKINTADDIQKKFIPWSEILTDFTKTVPSQVEIHSIKIDNKNWIIAGEAKNREILLEFKGGLEKSKYFSEIKSPITNLLQKENIEFELLAVPKFKNQ